MLIHGRCKRMSVLVLSLLATAQLSAAEEVVSYGPALLRVESLAHLAGGVTSVTLGGETFVASDEHVGRVAALKIARSKELFASISPHSAELLVRQAIREHDEELMRDMAAALLLRANFSDADAETIFETFGGEGRGREILISEINSLAESKQHSPSFCTALISLRRDVAQIAEGALDICEQYAIDRAIRRSKADDVRGALEAVQVASQSDSSLVWVGSLVRAYEAGVLGDDGIFSQKWVEASRPYDEHVELYEELRKLVLRQVVRESSNNGYYSTLLSALLLTDVATRSPLHHSAMLQLLRDKPSVIVEKRSDPGVAELLRIYGENDAEVQGAVGALFEPIDLGSVSTEAAAARHLRILLLVGICLLIPAVGLVALRHISRFLSKRKPNPDGAGSVVRDQASGASLQRHEYLRRCYQEALLFFHLSEDATLADIKAAYRRRIKQVHPDSAEAIHPEIDSVMTVTERYEELARLRRQLELGDCEA